MQALARRDVHLVAVACIAAVVGSLSACAPPCDLDVHTESLAGDGAIDCGSFSTGSDTSTGVECALRAQAGGHAFRLRVDGFGIDTLVANAWVRTAGGTRYALS